MVMIVEFSDNNNFVQYEQTLGKRDRISGECDSDIYMPEIKRRKIFDAPLESAQHTPVVAPFYSTLPQINGNNNHVMTYNQQQQIPQMRKLKQNSGIGALPENILVSVFFFLSQPELIRAVFPICQRWARIGRRNVLWRAIDFRNFKRIGSLSDVSDFLEALFSQHHGSIQSSLYGANFIIPAHCKNLTAQNFSKIRKQAPDIHGLHIAASPVPPNSGSNKSNMFLSNASLRQIARFTSMQRFEIPNQTRVSDEGILALAQGCAQLRSVVLNNCTGLTSKSLRYFAQYCPQISSVAMMGCGGDGLNGDDVSFLACNSKNMQELAMRLNGTDANVNAAFEQLSEKLVNLRSLIVTGYAQVTDRQISMICANLPRLETLSITCDHDSANGDLPVIMDPMVKSETLKAFHLQKVGRVHNLQFDAPQLRIIHLENVQDIQNMCFAQPQLQANNLQEFKAKFCTFRVELGKFLSDNTSLREVELFDCQIGSKLEIKALNLAKVTLFMCNELQHFSVDSQRLCNLVVEVCMELQNAEIRSPQLHDLQLFRLPQPQNPKLRNLLIQSEMMQTLNLQRCDYLENVNVNCANLDTLNLAGSKNLKKVSLHCPKLDKLALASSELQFTQDFIQSLTSNCPLISMLSLTNLNKLDDQALSLTCKLLTSLKALIIASCNGIVSPHLECHNLKGIQITDCDSLVSPLVSSQSLAKLFIRNCSQMSEEAITNLSQPHMSPNIKFMELFNCSGIKNISFKFTELLELVWNSCSNLSAIELSCPKLRKLWFLTCQSLVDIQFDKSSQNSFSNGINEILFSECNSINDSTVARLSQDIPQLQALVLSKCNNVNMPVLNFPKLRVVRFVECTNLIMCQIAACDSKVSTISFQHCPLLYFERASDLFKQYAAKTDANQLVIENLEFLNCGQLRNVFFDLPSKTLNVIQCKQLKQMLVCSPQVISAKISTCEALYMVGVCGCYKMKDISIVDCPEIRRFLVQGNSILYQEQQSQVSPSLSHVQIVNCPNIADDSVNGFLSTCPQLETVTLKNIGTTAPVVQHQRKLQKLSISSCNKLQRIAIAHCPLLQHLALSDCWNLSECNFMLNSNNQLLPPLPSLSSLDLSNTRVQKESLERLLRATHLAKQHMQSTDLKNTGITPQDRQDIMRAVNTTTHTHCTVNNPFATATAVGYQQYQQYHHHQQQQQQQQSQTIMG